MRHSRRAVMAERYTLYLKKNILNGKYFVRNMQIAIVFVIIAVMTAGGVILIQSDTKTETKVADAKTSVKEALFSNSEEEKIITKKETTEQTENTTEQKLSAVTEQVQNELGSAITEAMNIAQKTVEKEEPAKKEKKSKFDNKCIANVDETLNIRSNPSTEAEFVGSMNPGAIAIVEGTEGEWTKIKSGDVEGYVLSEYVLTGDSAEQFAKDYVTLRGTVLEDGVNIRSEKSTDADILVVLDKDATITVLPNETSEEENKIENEMQNENPEVAAEETVQTEENIVNVEIENQQTTEKEIVWLPVMLEDGQTGYVAADFVEVDELYEIAVSAEELQRRAEEEAARKAAEEEAARRAAEAASQSVNNNNSSNNNSSNNNSNNEEYQGATTKPVTATESGECIGTFTITAYCGCKKCSGGHSKTASGTTPTEGRTIAADTSILPFGTQVVIDGIVYTVEDCGSGVSGNHIDIFFATHAKALAFGKKTVKVYKY